MENAFRGIVISKRSTLLHFKEQCGFLGYDSKNIHDASEIVFSKIYNAVQPSRRPLSTERLPCVWYVNSTAYGPWLRQEIEGETSGRQRGFWERAMGDLPGKV